MKLVTTLQSFIPSHFEYMFVFVFMLGSIIYVYIYIFVLFGLKQVVNETCNNTKNCKMIMMPSFKLIKILNEEEQHVE
jgi:protein-S-isoprenylcysteine O-methyltransferase Ste14